MTENPKQTTAVAKCQSALRRQRRILLICVIVVAVLIIALIIANFLSSRTPFYDPVDNTKYYVVYKKGEYTLQDTDGNVMSTTADGNYLTNASTIVYIDDQSGAATVIATVLVEGSETTSFNYSNMGYDVLLYPIIERTSIKTIRIHNEKGEFAIQRLTLADGSTEFVIESRPDLTASNTSLFATLVYCTGYPKSLMRIDKELIESYAEYGLPQNTADADCYFIITATDGTSHKVIIGDEIPSGSGYYVRYEGRDAVYILYKLAETEYSSTFDKALFGTAEDFVTPVGSSQAVDNSNYFDVSDFKIYHADRPSPVVSFSYAGSIDKRNNTFYATVPYVSGNPSGYEINAHTVDNCLYTMFTWTPERAVEIGLSTRTEDIDEWLAPYGLDNDSFAYRISYMLNLARTYDASTGKDVLENVNRELHEILISEKQEDGLYYVYNICYLWDPEDGAFTKLATGYDMVVAIDESQLSFLLWEDSEWVDADPFSGNIAFMTELSVKVASGDATFPSGYQKTFYLNNSASFDALAASKSDQLHSNKMKVTDDSGKTMNTSHFKDFYVSLLYTSLTGLSSLDDTEKQAAISSGENGAALVIRAKYVLREFDPVSGVFVETGEVVERVYCFYRSYSQPREMYMTLNGEGDFYVIRSRVEKLIRDISKLYNPNDPIIYDSIY